MVLGGGRGNFFSKNEKDTEGEKGLREDGVNLIQEWLYRKEKMGVSPAYVLYRKDLLRLDGKAYDNVLGLFSRSHMPYNYETPPNKPTLSEMAQKAVEILSQNKNGFFLFIEGNCTIYFLIYECT